MDFSSSPIRSHSNKSGSLLGLPVRFLRYLWVHKLATAVVVLLALFFYWHQVRPIVIARQCAAQASLDARQLLKSKAEISKEKETRDSYQALVNKNMYLRSDYDSFLQKCLLHYGFQIEGLQRSNGAVSSSSADSVQK